MSEQVEKGHWPNKHIPPNWIWADFSETFTDRTDSRRKLPKKDYKQTGLYPVIDQGEEFVGGYSDDENLVSQASTPCIVWGDHTRSVKFIKDRFVQGADGVKVLEPTPAVNADFAYYAMQAVTLPDKGYSRHFKFLRSTQFPLPPIPEQCRIVAKLDSLFERTKAASAELARIPALVEHYKQAILAAAFDEALASAGHLTELRKLILEVRNGLSRRPENSPPGIPILKISAIRPMTVRLNERRYYVPVSGEDTSGLVLNPGDLLFTRYNGNPDLVANCGMVRSADGPLLYPDKLIRVRVDYDVADPAFVEIVVSCSRARSALAPFIKSAAGQHGISGGDLKRLQLPLPTLTVQRKIIRRIETAFAWLNKVAAEHIRAAELISKLEQAVLAKAFCGELVSQDPNDEPASILLNRVRESSKNRAWKNYRRKKLVPEK